MADFDDPFGDGWGDEFNDPGFDDEMFPDMGLDDPFLDDPAPEENKPEENEKSPSPPKEQVPPPPPAPEEPNEQEIYIKKMQPYFKPVCEIPGLYDYNITDLGTVNPTFSIQRFETMDELFDLHPIEDLEKEAGEDAKGFLQDPLDVLLQQYEIQEKQRASRKIEAIRVSRMRRRRGKRKDNLELWNDKYRPHKFQDLVSDDIINRDVLDWIRRFEKLVKGEDPYPEYAESGEIPPEVPRMCLLGGGAGVGKTTLARVLARTFNYGVNELNASDCRNAEDLKQRIELVASTRSFETLDTNIDASKGQLLILDEIDGVSTSGGAEGNKAIAGMVKIIKDDLRLKGKQGQWIIRAPIIAICNDMKSKSLRELMMYVKQLNVTKPNTGRLHLRLKHICKLEEIIVRDDVIRLLLDESNSDIRCCLNTLQLMSANRTEITLQDLKAHIARGGLKEYQAETIDLLNLVYVQRKNRRQWHKNPAKMMEILNSASSDFNVRQVANLMILNSFHLSYRNRILASSHVSKRLAFADLLDRSGFKLNAWDLKGYSLLVPMLTATDLFVLDNEKRKCKIQRWDQRGVNFREYKKQHSTMVHNLCKFAMEESKIKKGGGGVLGSYDPIPARNKIMIFRHLVSSNQFYFKILPFLRAILNPKHNKEWMRVRQGKMSCLELPLPDVDGLKSLESAVQLCTDFGLRMKEEGYGPQPDITFLQELDGNPEIPLSSIQYFDVFDREISQEVQRRIAIARREEEALIQEAYKVQRRKALQDGGDNKDEIKIDRRQEREKLAKEQEEKMKMAPTDNQRTGTFLDFFNIKKKKRPRNDDNDMDATQDTKKPKIIECDRNFTFSYFDGHTNAVIRNIHTTRFYLKSSAHDINPFSECREARRRKLEEEKNKEVTNEDKVEENKKGQEDIEKDEAGKEQKEMVTEELENVLSGQSALSGSAVSSIQVDENSKKNDGGNPEKDGSTVTPMQVDDDIEKKDTADVQKEMSQKIEEVTNENKTEVTFTSVM